MLVVLVILMLGTLVNFMMLSSSAKGSLASKLTEWAAQYLTPGEGNAVGAEGASPGSGPGSGPGPAEVYDDIHLKIGISGSKTTMKIDANDNGLKNLLNVDNIDPNDLNEWEKLANELSVHSESNSLLAIESEIAKSKSDADKQDSDLVNPQLDLAEILSINSIVLLVNDENVAQQEEVKKILQNLQINPEVKEVNLKKHPHYDDIWDYLKNYRVHNNEKNYHYVESLNEVDEIPRLFIGGLPVADYGDIVNKFNNNQLADFLNEFGRGLIKLQI